MTGPKDVIIIIDTSFTMLDGEYKFYHAVQACIKAVNALTYADYAQVIWYNSSSTASQGSLLLPMTDANKSTFIAWL
jgi:RecA-family ATPase